MIDRLIFKIKISLLSTVGFVLSAIFFLAAAGLSYFLAQDISNQEFRPSDLVFDTNQQVSSSTVLMGPILTSSEPSRLRIPKLNIDAGFVPPLGLEENNSVAVPDSDTEVGWYRYGPTPGALGPAVILGHVDSYTGPAIFYSLGQVDEGDDIYVDRVDGTTAHFKVEKLERHKQSEFPTEKVYGNINYAGLRLITCSGTYSKGEQKYSHNLVVYARLVE